MYIYAYIVNMYTNDFKGEELSNYICKLKAVKESYLVKLLKSVWLKI